MVTSYDTQIHMGQECCHLLARQRSDDIVRLIGLDADSALIKLTVQLLKSQSPTWFKSGTLQQGCHLVVQNTLSITIDRKKMSHATTSCIAAGFTHFTARGKSAIFSCGRPVLLPIVISYG